MKEKHVPPWGDSFEALVRELLEGEGGSPVKVPAPAGDRAPRSSEDRRTRHHE